MDKKSIYSDALLALAQEQLFLSGGVYDESTPEFWGTYAATLRDFNDYLCQRVKRMYLPQNNSDSRLSSDFFDNFVFHLTDDENPTAFLIDTDLISDGKQHVCVSKGFMRLIENEDELMGCVAHEVAHAIQKTIGVKETHKTEEAAADFMAMSHMKNAGYHPKYFKSMLEKLYASDGEEPSFAARFYDSHPSATLRLNAIDAFLVKNGNEYSAITGNIPLNEDILYDINLLPPTDHLLTNMLESEIFGDESLSAKISDLNWFLRDNRIFLYTNPREHVGLASRDDVWCYILKNRYDPEALLFKMEEEAAPDDVRQTVINKKYTRRIYRVPLNFHAASSKMQAEAIYQMFEGIKASNDGKMPRNGDDFEFFDLHDDLHLQLRILYGWGEKPFASTLNRVACLPDELKQVPELLKQLYKATEVEAQKIKIKLAPVRPILQAIYERYATVHDNHAKVIYGLLMPDLPRVHIGQEHPFAQWIERARKHYRETGRVDSIAHQVLRTFRVNDVLAFPFENNDECEGFLGIEPLRGYYKQIEFQYHDHTFTPAEIEQYQPNYCFSSRVIPQEDTVIHYTYDPKTFVVKQYGYGLEYENQVKQYIADTYDNMTLTENARFHYALKKRLFDLETAPLMPETVDTAAFFANGFYQMNPGDLFVPKTIKWPINSDYARDRNEKPQLVPFEMAESIRVTDRRLFSTDREPLFHFVNSSQTQTMAFDALLRLGRAAQNDPVLLDKLLETPIFWKVSKFGRVFSESPERQRAYFQLMCEEPFIHHVSKLRSGLFADKEYVQENFPDLLPKIYGYRVPQSGRDLNLAYLPFVTDVIYDKFTRERFLRDYEIVPVEQFETKRFLDAGRTDIPAPFLIRVMHSRKMDAIQHKTFQDALSRRDNWPAQLSWALTVLRKESQDARLGLLRLPLPTFAKGLMDDYYNRLVAQTNGVKRRALLALFWARDFNPLVDHKVRHKFFRYDSRSPGIWTGDLAEQIKTYKWLNFNRAFPSDGQAERDVLTHLLDELATRPAAEREQMAFGLLAKRNNIEFPALQQRAADMWIDAVAELMGGPDDMTPGYVKKAEPFIAKLHNTRSGVRKDKIVLTDDYAELSLELKARISARLQERLVSQEKLSRLLEPELNITGILTNSDEKNVIGGLLEIMFYAGEKRWTTAFALMDFLLAPPTINSAKKFHNTVREIRMGAVDSEFNKMIQSAQPAMWLSMHEQFWDKPLEVRAWILKTLEGFQHQGNPNKEMVHESMVDEFLRRIFQKRSMSYKEVFQNALRYYAEAVPADERYETYYLLAACLASMKPSLHAEELSRGVVIRTFLESQGAAGIKVGQFLASQDGVADDIRAELLKLTNHAATPSRAKVFDILRTYHPNAMAEVRQTGLGKLLGAASHYMTFDLNAGEVLSVAKHQTGLEAEKIYRRMLGAVESLMEDDDDNEGQLNIVRDAIKHVRRMNDVELDGNAGYVQMKLSQQLYDNVSMTIDGVQIDFKTMDWTRMPDPYQTYVSDGPVHWSQSYKIMEKAKGVDYDALETSTLKTAVAKANFMLNLRAVLMGGVFDDDRHSGQLKVDVQNPQKVSVNLFDTGSTGLDTPTRQEREELGAVLYDVLCGLKWKKGLLESVQSAMAFVRAQNDGETPPYLAKVSRAVANLNYFAADIPTKDLPVLMLRLINTPGVVHPDILRGMARRATPLERGAFGIIAPTQNVDKTVGTRVSEDDLITALNGLLTLPEIPIKADRKESLATLVEMIFVPHGGDVRAHIEQGMCALPNAKARRVVARHLANTLTVAAQLCATPKDSIKMRKAVIGYLSKIGLSRDMINTIANKLPTPQALGFKTLFMGGKLWLGQDKVAELIHEPLNRIVATIADYRAQLTAALGNTQMWSTPLVTDWKHALPPLASTVMNKTGLEGNRALTMVQRAYQSQNGDRVNE